MKSFHKMVFCVLAMAALLFFGCSGGDEESSPAANDVFSEVESLIDSADYRKSGSDPAKEITSDDTELVQLLKTMYSSKYDDVSSTTPVAPNLTVKHTNAKFASMSVDGYEGSATLTFHTESATRLRVEVDADSTVEELGKSKTYYITTSTISDSEGSAVDAAASSALRAFYLATLNQTHTDGGSMEVPVKSCIKSVKSKGVWWMYAVGKSIVTTEGSSSSCATHFFIEYEQENHVWIKKVDEKTYGCSGTKETESSSITVIINHVEYLNDIAAGVIFSEKTSCSDLLL